jgi:hypothetical protein
VDTPNRFVTVRVEISYVAHEELFFAKSGRHFLKLSIFDIAPLVETLVSLKSHESVNCLLRFPELQFTF